MDPLVLRFLERLAVVLIGGMAVYLGFRLFVLIPEQRDANGKIRLPWDISIVLTRVGPGVFFALFGVSAVALSLVRPLQIQPGDTGRALSYAADAMAFEGASRADARALLRRDIAVLNTMPQLLRRDLPAEDVVAVSGALARVKFALMRPVWGEAGEGFGDVAKFKAWVQAGETGEPPTGMEGALALYRYGKK